jgi:hypothetical protein
LRGVVLLVETTYILRLTKIRKQTLCAILYNFCSYFGWPRYGAPQAHFSQTKTRSVKRMPCQGPLVYVILIIISSYHLLDTVYYCKNINNKFKQTILDSGLYPIIFCTEYQFQRHPIHHTPILHSLPT